MLPSSYIKRRASNNLRQFYFLAERKLAKCENGTEFFQTRTNFISTLCPIKQNYYNTKMNIKYLLLCIIILFTSCNIEEKNLKDKKAISVVDLSSLQLNLMNKYISSKNRDSILVDSLYKPYLELWKLLCLSDESKFINWINDDMYKELDSFNIKQRELIPESIKTKMKKTALDMKNLTGYEPQGKVYIAYGRKWANLGVFGDSGTMLIDLAHKNNNSFEGITAFFAHELNHLIYAKTSKQTNRQTHLY